MSLCEKGGGKIKKKLWGDDCQSAKGKETISLGAEGNWGVPRIKYTRSEIRKGNEDL